MTKRVCELEVGDFFVYNNTQFKVYAIKDERVWYTAKWYAKSKWIESFGIKNKMKVEVIPVSIGGIQKTDNAHQPEKNRVF